MYGAVAVALVVTVVALAYGSQAPALGVAEFSPAAQQDIVAPPTTNSETSAASGRSGRRTTTTTAPPAATDNSSDSVASAAPTSVAARTRSCFGNPPQQLPDPRSPSCLATIFEGDNGGATSTGVTSTEIRVAWPKSGNDPAELAAVRAVTDYMNRYFEFYGRRLVLVPTQYGAASTVTDQRAVAANIGAQGVFAAVEPSSGVQWFPSWFNELARQRVVTVALGGYTLFSDREVFDPLHPFVWTVYPSTEQRWTNLSSLICTALVDRPARHAGPSLSAATRKFGILSAGRVRTLNVSPLIDGLRGCGIEPVTAQWTASDQGDAALRSALTHMKDGGVTTMICACTDDLGYNVASAARGISWEDPEWLMLFNIWAYDEYYTQNFTSAAQRSHLFGLHPLPRVGPDQNQWWWRAVKEMTATELTSSSSDIKPASAQGLYDQLLVLASGIQSAGPNLTPDTFAQGLMSTAFPNSRAGQEPDWLPSVGFGPGDHSFFDDYALAWWSDQATPYGYGTNARLGSWCYLDRGARFRVGQFPANADARFFDPNEPCR